MATDATRAVTALVAMVLLIALVVVLAAGVYAAGTAVESLDDPPPSVVAEAEDVTAACAGCGPDDQVVRLSHSGGDAVSLDAVTLAVTLPGHDRRARVVDLPLPTNCLPDDHVEGPDLFDGRCGRVSGSLTAVGADDDGVWSAGETLSVRLRKSAVHLDPGDEVVVRLVHTPSGTVVTERTAAVTAG